MNLNSYPNEGCCPNWKIDGFLDASSDSSVESGFNGGADLDFDLHLCHPADSHSWLSSQRSKSRDWSLLRKHPLQWHGPRQVVESSFSRFGWENPKKWHHKELHCDGWPNHKLTVKRQYALQSQCFPPTPFLPNIPKWNLKSWSFFLFNVLTWNTVFWYSCHFTLGPLKKKDIQIPLDTGISWGPFPLFSGLGFSHGQTSLLLWPSRFWPETSSKSRPRSLSLFQVKVQG